MANKPFEREVFNFREKPFSSDVNLVGTYADLALREMLKAIYSQRSAIASSTSTLPTIAQFLGDAFKVRPYSPASGRVVVSPGIGFVSNGETSFNIQNINGLNDASTLKPLVLTVPQTFVVPLGQFRTDIIEVRSNSFLTDSQSRDVFNQDLGEFSPLQVFKTFSWCLDGQVGYASANQNSTAALSYKIGVSDNSGTTPSITDGYTKIAEIHVGEDTSAITFTEANLVDSRFSAAPYGQVVISGKIELPRLALYTNDTDKLPKLVYLSAPPGLDAGCYLSEVGNLIASFTLNTFEIVVPGPYQTASVSLQLEGFNRQHVEIPQITASDFVEQSVDAWIKYVSFVDEIGIVRKTALASEEKTQSPITLNRHQPALTVGFSFKQVYEYLQGASIVAYPDFETDPVYVHFSIRI